MVKGGYDLVTASGDASLRLIHGKRVQPIDPTVLPNGKNSDPRLLNGACYTVNGKVYGAPYQWGPNLLLYSARVFPTPPTICSLRPLDSGLYCHYGRQIIGGFYSL